MTRDRLVSAFVVLAAVTVAVIVAWVAFFRHPQTVRRTVTGPVTVVVSPPLTPLPRDSGPKNNAVKKDRRTGPARRSGSFHSRPNVPGATRQGGDGPARGHSTPTTRKAPRPKPKRPASPQRPVYTPPASPPAPRPLVDVQAPLPTTVCLRPAVGVNCP